MDKSGPERRVGILGGTFDPVHIGHLILAQLMRDELDLGEVRFMPTFLPPHKHRPDILPSELRCEMLELALTGCPYFLLSRIEVDRQGVSYSIQTIRRLRRDEPDHEFYFLIGSDALPELAMWKQIDELRQLCRFAALRRPGADDGPWPVGMIGVTGPAIDISSSVIREYVRQGRSIRYLVPESVRLFIERQGLYKSAT